MLPENSAATPGPRHSILDLAPLELDCMNVLWPLGEATVRDVQQALRPTRPRAYTTIMTILDRLAQKGVVQRQKAGRAWLYRANLSAASALPGYRAGSRRIFRRLSPSARRAPIHAGSHAP